MDQTPPVDACQRCGQRIQYDPEDETVYHLEYERDAAGRVRAINLTTLGRDGCEAPIPLQPTP